MNLEGGGAEDKTTPSTNEPAPSDKVGAWAPCRLLRKYHDAFALSGHDVRDDSGNCAVFTEQGASASHMTAAQVSDAISRLPRCSGQASDAASESQRRTWTASTYYCRIFQRSGCGHHDQDDRNLGVKFRMTQVFLERHLCSHPWAGFCMGARSWKYLARRRWGKIAWIGVLWNSPKMWIFLSVWSTWLESKNICQRCGQY